jgi:hypothetical protein
VLVCLAAAQCVFESRETYPLGHIVEVAGENGAGLNLIEQDMGTILRPLPMYQGSSVARGKKVCGRWRGNKYHNIRAPDRISDIFGL